MNRHPDSTGAEALRQDLRVLVIEPYYGGSHKIFIDALVRALPFEFELMTLPPRKWKWRMRLSGQYFADLLRADGRRFDRIVCSSFLDVAAFRGAAPAWVREVPLLTFFHENQFAYPTQVDDPRDMHFGLTNMTTALASDAIGFNSRYNLDTLAGGVVEALRHSSDMGLEDPVGRIRARSEVLGLPLDYSDIDEEPDGLLSSEGAPPVIVWNHRWEHDKGPEEFFNALYRLDGEGVDFRLVVLGESFERRPEIFEEARLRLKHRTLHFGYAGSRTEYARWLRRGDIVASTSTHEFFGISVLEAVRAGCRPLVPNDLSYPELFPEEYLYPRGKFYESLKGLLIKGVEPMTPEASKELTERFSLDVAKERFEGWIKYGGNTSKLVRSYFSQNNIEISNERLINSLNTGSRYALEYILFAIRNVSRIDGISEVLRELASNKSKEKDLKRYYCNKLTELHAVYFVENELKCQQIEVESKSRKLLSPHSKKDRASCDIKANCCGEELFFEVKDASSEYETSYKKNNAIYFDPMGDEKVPKWIFAKAREAYEKGANFLICRVPVWKVTDNKNLESLCEWFERIFKETHCTKVGNFEYDVMIPEYEEYFRGIYLIKREGFLKLNVKSKCS